MSGIVVPPLSSRLFSWARPSALTKQLTVDVLPHAAWGSQGPQRAQGLPEPEDCSLAIPPLPPPKQRMRVRLDVVGTDHRGRRKRLVCMERAAAPASPDCHWAHFFGGRHATPWVVSFHVVLVS